MRFWGTWEKEYFFSVYICVRLTKPHLHVEPRWRLEPSVLWQLETGNWQPATVSLACPAKRLHWFSLSVNFKDNLKPHNQPAPSAPSGRRAHFPFPCCYIFNEIKIGSHSANNTETTSNFRKEGECVWVRTLWQFGDL